MTLQMMMVLLLLLNTFVIMMCPQACARCGQSARLMPLFFSLDCSPSCLRQPSSPPGCVRFQLRYLHPRRIHSPTTSDFLYQQSGSYASAAAATNDLSLSSFLIDSVSFLLLHARAQFELGQVASSLSPVEHSFPSDFCCRLRVRARGTPACSSTDSMRRPCSWRAARTLNTAACAATGEEALLKTYARHARTRRFSKISA